jgi:superfamily I DNA/RNA helicase
MSWLRFPGVTQVAVYGCAGSGKTLIAVERAAELAQRGKRVLLTCFNRALARMLINHPKLKDTSTPIVVNNVHTVVNDLYRDQRLTGSPDAMKDIANLCLDSRTKYDAIIIDEAQDFETDWLEALRFLLEDPDKGYLYLFLDTNQNIYRQDVDALVQRLEVNPFPLQQNMRNTQQIGQIIRQTLPDAHEIIFQGPHGDPVIERSYSTAQEMIELIAKDVSALLKNNVPANRMVVLTPKAVDKSNLYGIEDLADLSLVDDVFDEKNQLLFTSIYKFKGLESTIVFLVDIDTRKNQADGTTFASNDRYQKYVNYVGASRARVLLYLYREK